MTEELAGAGATGTGPASMPVPAGAESIARGGGRPELLPPRVLAYVGDAVYDLFIRERLVRSGAAGAAHLHRQATAYVRAGAQAAALQALLPELEPEEAEIVRRGRNAHVQHPPRGVGPAEYRGATAFEALVGYLYLAGRRGRLDQVLRRAAELIEQSRQ